MLSSFIFFFRIVPTLFLTLILYSQLNDSETLMLNLSYIFYIVFICSAFNLSFDNLKVISKSTTSVTDNTIHHVLTIFYLGQNSEAKITVQRLCVLLKPKKLLLAAWIISCIPVSIITAKQNVEWLWCNIAGSKIFNTVSHLIYSPSLKNCKEH